MDSKTLPAIPGVLVANGKLYSPYGGSLLKGDDSTNYLRFSLSLSQDANNQPGLKLVVKASRNNRKEDNPAHIPEYEASLFFDAGGLFNFVYNHPDTASAITPIFHVPVEQDVTSLRTLTFAANEFSINMGKVPRLRTDEMGIDLVRLFKTAKSAILLPDAILDVTFLIYAADGTTDFTMQIMEHVLFDKHPHLHLPSAPKTESPPKSQTLQKLPTSNSTKVLSMDMLAQMYKNKINATTREGSSPTGMPFTGSPLRPGIDLKVLNWSSPFGKSAFENSEDASTNKFHDNSPPKFLDPKHSKVVCFNCYAIGHRDYECIKPKRIPGAGAKKGHKSSKTVSGDLVGNIFKGKLSKKNASEDLRGNVNLLDPNEAAYGDLKTTLSKKAVSSDLRSSMEKA